MQQRLEQLETKVAFLEQANAQLSDELYRQQQQLEALRIELASLLERLDAAQSQATTYSPEDEKPPHY
jgi:SlyX protein